MTDEVRKRSAAVEQMAHDWPLVDDLLGGTRKMRGAGERWLPMFPAEDLDGYKARLATATLFEGFERTVDVLAAKPFSKPVRLSESVPERIRGTDSTTGWAEDIDLQGRSLHVFAGDLCREALSHGLSGILIEYPVVRQSGQGRRMTQAEEQATGARPYWVHIHPKQLLGWRAARENGAWRLTQLRFVETVTEDDGEFGEKAIEQVRVLEPRRWRIYRQQQSQNQQAGSWQLHEEGVTTLGKIPFVPVYGKRCGFMLGRSPLLGLAYLNQKHWSEQSDQDKAVHYARARLIAAIGVDDESTITVGADYMLRLPMGGDLKVAQGSGESVKVGQEHIAALEDQMRQAGAELLVIKPGNTSVPQTLADDEAGKCLLQRIAEDLEDSLDQALQLTAEWVGEKSGGNAQLFKDFGAKSLAEASGELLLKSASAGKISDQTYFEELQRRGTVAPDRKWVEEQERISDQPPPLGGIGSGNGVDE